MENIGRTNNIILIKTKILKGAVMTAFALLIGHVNLLNGCFPAAVAFITYMVSKSRVNIYFVMPVLVGIVPYMSKGYDIWGDVAAVCICAFLFALTGKINMQLWQTAVTASCTEIVCVSIYRLATATVYKMSLENLFLSSLLVFSFVFVFDVFFGTIGKHYGKNFTTQISAVPEISLASFAAVCLLIVCGTGFESVIWACIVFICLWSIVYIKPGQAVFVTVAGSVMAALAGQMQWGIMTTILIAAAAAFFSKQLGNAAAVAVFVFTCMLLKTAESSVVLGIDNISLFSPLIVFVIVNWRFGKVLKAAAENFGGSKDFFDKRDNSATELLFSRAEEMKELSELYGTYLDNRSILANQFNITKQIMDDVRRGIQRKRGVDIRTEKLEFDIAVSQCAAVGEINGDCCGWHNIGEGRIAMVVSDGMGKGKKAAAESLMVVKTIMAMLKCGVTADLTLKMINIIMLMKNDEDSFATVDLLIADKMTGRTKFYKIGAAPTLLRRKSSVEEVKLSAVPLGIVNGLKIKYVEVTLKRGDWIVMMSDGVSDGGNGEFISHIKETVAHVRSEDPRTMCNLVMNQAADSYIGRERDDLTVMVARVT